MSTGHAAAVVEHGTRMHGPFLFQNLDLLRRAPSAPGPAVLRTHCTPPSLSDHSPVEGKV